MADRVPFVRFNRGTGVDDEAPMLHQFTVEHDTCYKCFHCAQWWMIEDGPTGEDVALYCPRCGTLGGLTRLQP